MFLLYFVSHKQLKNKLILTVYTPTTMLNTGWLCYAHEHIYFDCLDFTLFSNLLDKSECPDYINLKRNVQVLPLTINVEFHTNKH